MRRMKISGNCSRLLLRRWQSRLPIQSNLATRRLASGSSGAAHPPSRMSAAKRTALTQIYNEMHGLIVGVGKSHCKKSQPHCDGCILQIFLPAVK